VIKNTIKNIKLQATAGMASQQYHAETANKYFANHIMWLARMTASTKA